MKGFKVLKIYLDIVLLENFIMNYIILFSTAIISKSKVKYWKIGMASLIAGLYSILNYLWNLGNLESLLVKFLISVMIVLIGFESRKLKVIFKQLILFYLVSFTFGGISFMLLFLINPANVVFENGLLVGIYPVKVTIIGGILGAIVISVVSYLIRDRMRTKSMLCDLEIFYKGKYQRLKTMIDTGNLLKEPISQTDVIIVEKNSLRTIISDDILDHIDDIIQGKWLGSRDDIYAYKLKVIPFSSLGNENGLLIGFKPDYIKILDEEECVRDDVMIGIYNGKLCKSNLYTSLIGLDILNNKKTLKEENWIR